MIKFFISTILCLISFDSNYPQWTNQNPVPDGNDLWSTFFIDDTGWIVGEYGFIKKTTNAGLDWIQQTSGTTVTLRSVQFIDQNTGWICGDEGLIIKTNDGGQNWFELTSGTSEKLVDIHFYDLYIGWLVGDGETILKTTNGGTSWAIQSLGTSFNLNSVDFVDAFIGYAVGTDTVSHQVLLKTTDGGLNWIDKSPVLDMRTILNAVEFRDSNVGYIGGAEAGYFRCIYKTTDGGESWIRCVLQNFEDGENSDLMKIRGDEDWGITSIFFKDSNNGCAVGLKTYISTTTDGGLTWVSKHLLPQHNAGVGLSSAYINNSGNGWVVGNLGVIYITENDGNSWTQILSGKGISGDNINSIFFMNENIGWAAGKKLEGSAENTNVILKTTNGGKIWKTQYISGSGPIIQLYCVTFIDSNNGWVVGDNKILKTSNSGTDWVEQTTTNELRGVSFTDVNNGCVVGVSGTILKTTNGGLDWSHQTSGTTNELNGVSFLDVNNGISVGAGGIILRTTNGGATWTQQTSGTINNLNSIKSFNNNLVMCVGDTGTVLFSSDGGENWLTRISGTTNDLKAVSFTNSTSVWVTGSNGKILSTTDLGNNWISHDDVTTNDLTSVFFINESMGWIGGLNGTILKYQNDVIPVELVSFSANVENNKVELSWLTATELNNYGFEIERKATDNDWTNLGFVEGYGNSTSPKSYSYVDISFIGGNNFQYRLKQIDIDGSFNYSSVVDVEIFPQQYELGQNYPNPFNPSTVIEFSLPEDVSNVNLSIYNALGERIVELVNTALTAGKYQYQWNAQNVATGMYIFELRTDKFVFVKKMVLIK